MPKTTLLTNDDPRRHSTDDFIKKICADRYGARPEIFPSRIIAASDNRDKIPCAAGLRFLTADFSSECYLDTSIENEVNATSARPADRNAIFELTTLANPSEH
jgi:hypothetical protein